MMTITAGGKNEEWNFNSLVKLIHEMILHRIIKQKVGYYNISWETKICIEFKILVF